MADSFSPIVMKIAGEVVAGKRKRDFQAPTDVCLEEWWLLKPDGGNGIAVGGRPVEKRSILTFDIAPKGFDSAPSKKRYASREFQSGQVVKRHSCTTVESSDGVFVYLCGFINRSRTKQNGFSSEICRDFLYGFPLNWEDYAAKSACEESSQNGTEHFSERFLPAAMDSFNGAQLHDMVLSLTDAEREILNKKMYDDLKVMLDPELINGITLQPSKPSPSSVIDEDILTPNSSVRKVKKKWQQSVSRQTYNEQKVGVASLSSCSAAANQPNICEMGKSEDTLTSRNRVCRTARKLENQATKEKVTISPKVSARKIHSRKPNCARVKDINHARIEKNVTDSPKASVKQGPVEGSARKIHTRRRDCASLINVNRAGIEDNVTVSPKASVKGVPVDRLSGVARTLRSHSFKSTSDPKTSVINENVIPSPKAFEEQRALRSATRSGHMVHSNEGRWEISGEGKKIDGQSELMQLLEHRLRRGKGGIRLLRELL